MFRRIVRRTFPYEARWRLRAAERAIGDQLGRVRFAAQTRQGAEFGDVVCRYERPLICYPGQEHVFEYKRRNIVLSLGACNRALVRPGETFSFWHLVGRPTAARGYGAAASIKDGALVEDTGGAVCFSSTLLYNAGLLSGMEIVERRCHSIDSYGDARYFELGRDAAVEHPYTDLRLRNRGGVPLLITTGWQDDTAFSEVRTRGPLDLRVELEIDPPLEEPGRLIVRGRRITRRNGRTEQELLPESIHLRSAH